MCAVSVSCRGGVACDLSGHGGTRGRRGRNGVATSCAIATAPELPGGSACPLALARRVCGAFYRCGSYAGFDADGSAGLGDQQGRVAALLSVASVGLPVCRWCGVSARDARARCALWWIGARAVCCAAVPRNGAVVTSARRARRCSAHGGVSGAGLWRRVLAVGALADVPAAAWWLGALGVRVGGARRVERWGLGPLSRCGGGVATVTVVLGAEWTVCSCRVLVRSAQHCGLVAHAQRDPRHTHHRPPGLAW